MCSTMLGPSVFDEWDDEVYHCERNEFKFNNYYAITWLFEILFLYIELSGTQQHSISSSNFPHSNYDSQDKVRAWQITTDPSKFLRVRLNYFDIEGEDYDFLYIQ